MGQLLGLRIVEASEFYQWSPDWCDADGTKSEPSVNSESGLDHAELHFLKTILNHPGKASSAYAKLAGISTKKALSLRRRLVDKGWLREERLNLKGRGRSCIVVQVTEKGRELLENNFDEAS